MHFLITRVLLMTLCGLSTVFSLPLHAAGDLSGGDPIRVDVRLGTDEGLHRFVPDRLSFETGKLYALRINNPSANSYYFGSQGFADVVFTRKVVVLDKDGNDMAQVYGPVRRIEVKPGNRVEWWFVPVRTGQFNDLRSTRTHSEAGMNGMIEVR